MIDEWLCNPPELQRQFFHLRAHVGRHPSHVHHWNPYWYRAFTPHLDRAHFDAFCGPNKDGAYGDPKFAFMGCLDAPDTIPLGGTASIRTVGGWCREEYLNAPRDCEDWGRRLRAEHETGEMLKKLLAEAEAADQAG
jgi:hypothetical protein